MSIPLSILDLAPVAEGTSSADALKQTKKEVKKADVQERKASKLSPMPEGLVNVLSKDEILDLIAYLQSGGKPKFHAFKK